MPSILLLRTYLRHSEVPSILLLRTHIGHSEASATYFVIKNFRDDGGNILFIVINYCDECLTLFGVSFLPVCTKVVELALCYICDFV